MNNICDVHFVQKQSIQIIFFLLKIGYGTETSFCLWEMEGKNDLG